MKKELPDVCFVSFLRWWTVDGWTIVVMGGWDCCVHLITFTCYNCLILVSLGEEFFCSYSGFATQSIGWRILIFFHCHIRINLGRACVFCARSMFFILATWCAFINLLFEWEEEASRCGPVLLEPVPCVMSFQFRFNLLDNWQEGCRCRNAS